MAPVLTKALTRLRADIDTRFPARDKSTDGWIGDADHQEHVSGHNPDDTEGSRAEYSDADTKAEVRAIDVDKDLRDAAVSMQQVIDQILRTANDLMRLKYIIYNRRIWSKSNNWVPKEYTGTNPHTEHAHFSGDPVYDEDASAWSVLGVGVTQPWSTADVTAIKHRVDAIIDMDLVNPYGDGLKSEPNRLAEAINEISAQTKANNAAVVKLTADVAELKTLMTTMMGMLEAHQPVGTLHVSGDLQVS